MPKDRVIPSGNATPGNASVPIGTPTYRIITLGCKVNHYESLQVEELLRSRGYTPATNGKPDLIIVNTCSVTAGAGAKSRNILRRSLKNAPKTLAMGCWATSNPQQAREIVGPDAVLTHQDDLATALNRQIPNHTPGTLPASPRVSDFGFQISNFPASVSNLRFEISDFQSPISNPQSPISNSPPGSLSLPQLHHRQPQTQRAILKIQDGCDAHCTYCIIPKLRPLLWSRPPDQVVEEARRMVAAGHHEIVLTGVFLGAYGQSTALHRRQTDTSHHLADLVTRLCTDVPGLHRLRLSSLEPADLTPALIAALRAHSQVMPHFHLPLQSGSDAILKRMNRQYTLDAYLSMVDQLKQAFDRPAITTDIIVGFPGETDDDFHKTLDAARSTGFLHIHAFPYSPREDTAASRWKKEPLPQRITTQRMHELEYLSTQLSQTYRQQFLNQEVELLVEHPSADETAPTGSPTIRHGRCERYFPIHFESPYSLTGQLVGIRIDRVTSTRTLGQRVPSL